VVIGISTDKLEDQVKFTQKESLNFPLFADADKTASKAYGVLNEKSGFAMRWTFIIDKKGDVRKIYNKVDTKNHPQEVYDYIKENLK
jgi:peroxiredoxin Q/BCP